MQLFIDLYKGVLNTAKLVKKAVQVKGKNGKVFTRMQWVDPNDASTGHGVRQIKSSEGLKQAHRDGIDEHPQYHKALKDQGVDVLNHEDHHPHFFLPETYDSAANLEHRHYEGDWDGDDTAKKEKKHAAHYPHGEKPSPEQHKMHQNTEDGLGHMEEDKFSRDYGIHPEIHAIMDHISKHLETPDGYGKVGMHLSRSLSSVGNSLKDEHQYTIKNHISAKIQEEAGDKFVENVQRGALKEGNTSNSLSLVASHPQIARHTINKILGENFADTLRRDLEEANMSVNFPVKNIGSIEKNGYIASTMHDYVRNEMGEKAIEALNNHVSQEFSHEGARIEAISDLPDNKGDWDWNEVYDRANAEYRAIGLTLEDRKPTYIALNHINNPTGGAKEYGARWLKVSKEKEVLNHCTATFDDSFADTRAVAKVFDMDHLKDLFILKAIDKSIPLANLVGRRTSEKVSSMQHFREIKDNYDKGTIMSNAKNQGIDFKTDSNPSITWMNAITAILDHIGSGNTLSVSDDNMDTGKPWYSDWGIPIELQYHQPSLSTDQFDIQTDESERPEPDHDDLDESEDYSGEFGFNDELDDFDDLEDFEFEDEDEK